MTVFLTAFLAAYTGMHFFVYQRTKVLLPAKGHVLSGIFLFFLFMILAPIIAHLSDRSGHELQARVVGWIGYPWMGFIFLAFWGFVFAGTLDVILKAVGSLIPFSTLSLSGRRPVGIVLFLVGLVWVYGFLEARWVRVEKVTLHTGKLPANQPRFRIAQISDVHLGILTPPARLRTIVDKILSESPDLLVCTGDMVDGNSGSMERYAPILQGIAPPFGKYAVTGNHECYVGLGPSVEALQSFGFIVLRDTRASVGNVLNMVGVDDPAGGSRREETDLLSGINNGLFTVLLKHRPEVTKASRGLFDLQLSGHTHGGQIFPFGFFTGLFYPLQNGFHRLDNGSHIYTSRGSGTWGPPLRVLSPPEVTIIDLVREEGTSP